MIITKLDDLNRAIQSAYQNSDRTQSFDIKLSLGWLFWTTDVTGGINLQYFSSLKEYQILWITIVQWKKKVDFTKGEKMSIIKWFSSQLDLYDVLSKILKSYTGIK